MILLNQPAQILELHPVVLCVMPISVGAFAVDIGSKFADFGFGQFWLHVAHNLKENCPSLSATRSVNDTLRQDRANFLRTNRPPARISKTNDTPPIDSRRRPKTVRGRDCFWMVGSSVAIIFHSIATARTDCSPIALRIIPTLAAYFG